jgi:hypothetical protein
MVSCICPRTLITGGVVSLTTTVRDVDDTRLLASVTRY